MVKHVIAKSASSLSALFATLFFVTLLPGASDAQQGYTEPTTGPVYNYPGEIAAQRAAQEAAREEQERVRRQEELERKLKTRDMNQIMHERGLSRAGSRPVIQEYRVRPRGLRAVNQAYYRRAPLSVKPKSTAATNPDRSPLPPVKPAETAKQAASEPSKDRPNIQETSNTGSTAPASNFPAQKPDVSPGNPELKKDTEPSGSR